MEGCGDGEWSGHRYFTCLPGRAFFCPVTSLKADPHTSHSRLKATSPENCKLTQNLYRFSTHDITPVSVLL